MQCAECGGSHKRYLIEDRSMYKARYCGTCDTRHPVNEVGTYMGVWVCLSVCPLSMCLFCSCCIWWLCLLLRLPNTFQSFVFLATGHFMYMYILDRLMLLVSELVNKIICNQLIHIQYCLTVVVYCEILSGRCVV